MILYLLRHGISTRKALGFWGRNFNAPLALEHLTMLNASRDTIKALRAPSLFSSPLLRCQQSLIYASEGKWPITEVPEFRAYHSGQLEEATEVFVRKNFPEYAELTYSEKFNTPRYGEESIAYQAMRVRRGLVQLLSLPQSCEAVVCSHYSVITIICNLVARNFNLATYGAGDLEISEGGLIKLSVNPKVLLADITK